MDSWGEYKTPCPNCGGKVEWYSFGSDCRGNSGSNGINCTGSCKREFTHNEWEIIAKKELKEKRKKEKEFLEESRLEAIADYNKKFKKKISKKNKK